MVHERGNFEADQRIETKLWGTMKKPDLQSVHDQLKVYTGASTANKTGYMALRNHERLTADWIAYKMSLEASWSSHSKEYTFRNGSKAKIVVAKCRRFNSFFHREYCYTCRIASWKSNKNHQYITITKKQYLSK